MRTDRHRLVDSLTRRLVALGGWSVLAAIALIFLFLLWVVAPIFAPVSVERLSGMESAIDDPVAFATNDTGDVASLITRDGELVLLDMRSASGAGAGAGRGRPEVRPDRSAGQGGETGVSVRQRLRAAHVRQPHSFPPDRS